MNTTGKHRVPAGLEEFAGDKQFATTLARGLELLRCFTPDRPILGNSELAQMLQLPKATISRLTYTLLCMGYLTGTEFYGKYQLGAATLSVGYPLLAQLTLRRMARPLMLSLANLHQCTVSIGIRDRLSMVYVEVIRASNRQVYAHDVGSTHPILGTALGRAYLMGCSASAREALLNHIRVKDPAQWHSYSAKALDNLKDFVQFGCCTSVAEVLPDVQAVAVPLGRINNVDVAAINCTFQGRTLDLPWLRHEIAPQLQALARQLN